MPSLMSVRDRRFSFFETPPHYIAALLGEVNVCGRVYEPCVGEGAIASALRKQSVVKSVFTNDIDEDRHADTHYDATREIAAVDKFDWAITNPPFSDELDILEMTMPSAHNLAFLARLSFLEPTGERDYFLEQHPPNQVIVLPRYSFRPNDEGKRQTDSVTCCWLVWFQDNAPRRVSSWGKGKAQAYATIRGLDG